MPKAEQDDSRNMSLLFYQIRQIRGLQRLLVQRQMPLTQQKKFANHSLINLLGKKDNGIKRYQRYQNRSRDTKIRPMSLCVIRTFQDMIVEGCGCYPRL